MDAPLDGSQGHYAEWKKQVSKGYILNGSIYTDGILGKSKAIERENRFVVARDWGEGMTNYKGEALENSSGCWNCSVSCGSYKNLGM